jgi:hypothetical protein
MKRRRIGRGANIPEEHSELFGRHGGNGGAQRFKPRLCYLNWRRGGYIIYAFQEGWVDPPAQNHFKPFVGMSSLEIRDMMQ